MKRITLRKEIIIDITILLISALLLIGVIVLKVTESLLIDQKINASQIIITSLNNTINSIFQKDEKIQDEMLAQELINIFANENSFTKLIIADKSGKILASSKKDENGNRISNKKFNGFIKKGVAAVEKENGNIFIIHPLYLRGMLIGGIIGELAIDDIKDRLGEIWMLVIVFILIDAVIFIGFGMYLLSKTVITPIKELVEAVSTVAKGDFDKRIAVKDDNEIGKLSASFNTMTDSLKEKLTLLKNKNIELERVKDEIIQSEKLASVGRLAAGVAHEIGNPLGAIKSYIDILLKEKNFIDKDILLRMEKDGNRIDKIVRELLTLASPSRGIIDKVNINSVIKGTLDIISGQKAFDKIKINLFLSDDIPVISIDEQKIQQVIVNILINSLDAMPDGGEVTISSRVTRHKTKQKKSIYNPRRTSDQAGSNFSHLRTTETLIKKDIFKEGEKIIKLDFSDTGTGIKAEDISKIFDPFFTTKEPGKGTGLGLSICHRIIVDAGGKIAAYSTMSKGTSIEILLPVDS